MQIASSAHSRSAKLSMGPPPAPATSALGSSALRVPSPDDAPAQHSFPGGSKGPVCRQGLQRGPPSPSLVGCRQPQSQDQGRLMPGFAQHVSICCSPVPRKTELGQFPRRLRVSVCWGWEAFSRADPSDAQHLPLYRAPCAGTRLSPMLLAAGTGTDPAEPR